MVYSKKNLNRLFNLAYLIIKKFIIIRSKSMITFTALKIGNYRTLEALVYN